MARSVRAEVAAIVSAAQQLYNSHPLVVISVALVVTIGLLAWRCSR